MRRIFFLMCLCISQIGFGQVVAPFQNFSLRIDTAIYDLNSHHIFIDQKKHLYFEYSDDQPTVEFRLYTSRKVDDLVLHASTDFKLIDSLVWIHEGFYKCKVQFEKLEDVRMPNLTFTFVINETEKSFSVPLFPYQKTLLSIRPSSNNLFIGEEKVFALLCNNPQNILMDNQWVEEDGFEYRLSMSSGEPQLHILPKRLGGISLDLAVKTRQPFLSDDGQIMYELPPLKHEFTVKASRLTFLEVNLRDVILSESGRKEGVEIQLSDHPQLVLGKTYRVENQHEPGGALIAELFTRNRLSNNRVLCWLRTYNYHNISDNYLYIKDGDTPMFISNFNVLHQTEISNISILSNQGEWTSSQRVYPGQTVDLKLEGEGLNNAVLVFEGAEAVVYDSLIGNDNIGYYRIKIPMDIRKKSIKIIENGRELGKSLSVAEYSVPSPLNFVQVNFGTGNKPITKYEKQVLYDHVVNDIRIEFDTEAIDHVANMHGIQYVDIQIELRTSKNQLIDMREIEDIAVCPGLGSPRYGFYSRSKCADEVLSLNQYLNKKTYELNEWSKIGLTVRHNKNRHPANGYQDRLEIVQKKTNTFDIDVSFPAGLITKRVSRSDFDNLGGISMAMIAQFTFYHPERIAIERPYKIGAGFIALNAFNFNENANRDIGLVVLGSLYPRSNSRLTFPLYLGGGFLLADADWFFMLGPGIRVSL